MKKIAVFFALALWACAAAAGESRPGTDTAIFAGGCFWSMEAVFDDVPGVVSATSGYTGGTLANPTYRQVSAGDTGHVEAVRIVYDPQKISYAALLDLFWHNVDMFNPNGQFCDNAPEYRSEIFTLDKTQQEEAQASKAAVEKRLGKPTVTKILPATVFYPAEDYHQHFKHKNPLRYGMYRQACGRDAKIHAIWGD